MSAERQTPRVIPVLDVMNGRVVRAVGGLREKYQPISCPFSGSHKPFDVATALLQQSGANELYVADLDAIMGDGTLSMAIRELIGESKSVFWLDVGLRSWETYRQLPYRPTVWPVIASETAGPVATAEIAASLASGDPFAFSIDLRDGKLFCDWREWGLRDERDGLGLARRAITLGAPTLIVLDLARVGTGTGSGTEPLLTAIRDEFPEVELIAGGGVKTWADIDRLGAAGADAVLVASALHEGTIKMPRV